MKIFASAGQREEQRERAHIPRADVGADQRRAAARPEDPPCRLGMDRTRQPASECNLDRHGPAPSQASGQPGRGFRGQSSATSLPAADMLCAPRRTSRS